ncbi:MAG: DUF3127 domain-containing protein [Cyclobacteriaceae bacterium]
MNIEAKLIEKFDTQDVTSSFKKREFVVEYAENPQYPEFIKFELIQSNCSQLDSYQPGDNLNISFNLKGRKWTDPKGEVKYFNSLQAWKIEGNKSSAEVPSPPMSETPPPPTQADSWMDQGEKSDDDLPF